MLFEKSPLPMWMYDRDTLRFVAVNEAAIASYGYTRDEFLAMTIANIRPKDDVAALRDDVATSVGLTAPRTWRHLRKDGSEIAVEIKANDFVYDGRDVRLVLAIDVTARELAQRALNRTEDQLRQAQKMDAIGQLAGGVAHDFNNILTVIGGYTRFVEDALAGDPRIADVVEIRRAAERGAVITRQLLAVSRHSMVSPRSIQLDVVVADLVPMLKRLAGDRVKVVVHRGDAPPPVLADPGQLEQVLMNLTVNARDAMPDGGRITIETQPTSLDADAATARGVAPGAYAMLAVTDTGVGMTAETQARMFDPFFTTKDAGAGTGLGLSIVHGIIAQAGGTIAVYSELGHGTTFRVLLPATTEVVAAPGRAAHDGPRTLPALTALVVDDERDVRAVAARILTEAGCRVLEAASADEARQLCVGHDGAIDVVVLDVVLSDGRGDVVVHQLRELRPAIATVLMSGYPAGALSQGALPPDLLPKPFSPGELRAAVARAIGGRLDSSPVLASPHAGARPTRVLLAEDDRELRRAIARSLGRGELEVVAVADGAEAIRALEVQRFDVILSDVHMPGCSGVELLRAVRRVDLDVPVVLMSGAPDVESASRAVELGAFRYLTKPLDLEWLARTVHHASRAHVLARLRREAFAIGGARAGAVDRAGLEVRFESALDGMWLACQSIVEARNGAPFGVEALMRTEEPSMSTPGMILDAATQLERLPSLGRRVRSLAGIAMAAQGGDGTWFVNLHPDDLADVDLVAATAPLTQVARRVVLEITERAALDCTPALALRLAQLRGLGFRIAVDDIGAGYSGLSSFTELTPEIIKVDMSLVRDIHLSALKQRVVAALCRLSHEVGTLVVAEGIESHDERDCLVGLGCDLLQGFLIDRPTRLPS